MVVAAAAVVAVAAAAAAVYGNLYWFVCHVYHPDCVKGPLAILVDEFFQQ